ncbi:MAG: hypothetical protein IJJ82_04520 [Clostridia bacterium]|nr:hypothetical protein [Clostridia bacterium]
MENINQCIKICNKMYIRQIKKIVERIKNKKNLNDSCKNNLCASGELIIDTMKLMENGQINVALLCLRNIYEMTLKAIVLDDNQEILDSYNKIIKSKEKDKMSVIREYIAKDFNKYFSIIEKDENFDNILGKGILTYVYEYLCKYSHATKVNEFMYLIQKNNELKEYLNSFLFVFLIYSIILIYTDAVCTKIKFYKIADELFILNGILMPDMMSNLLNDKKNIENLSKFSKNIFGEPDDLFNIRIDSEKKLINHYAMNCEKEIVNNDIQKETWDMFCNYYLSKYFTQKEREKLGEIKNEK